MITNENFNLFGSAFQANPYPTYAHLRENAPIYRIIDSNDHPVWVITRYKDAIAVLSDPRFVKNFRNALTTEQLAGLPTDKSVSKVLNILESSMLDTDPPNHTRLRRLVSKAFTPNRIEQLRPNIQAIADELLDKVQDKGAMDLIGDYAFPLPISVITQMLGIPATENDKFRQWSNAMVETEDIHPNGEVLAAATEFFDYLRTLFSKRRQTPTDDLISCLIAAEEQGDKLSEDELISMVHLLIVAGHETTVNLIGNSTLALLQYPSQLALLQNNPSLIKSAIEEFLRYNAPVQTTSTRYTCEDVEIDGHVIPKGELVLVVLGAANHDPTQFENPNDLNIVREIKEHLAFGYGIHYCLGVSLARIEGEIAINTLLRRMPNLQLALTPDELRWRPGIHTRGLQFLPVRF